MKISIITGTYNAGSTLACCLDSLKSQTIDLEHIVVDGGSTDETLSIVGKHRLDNSVLVSERDDGIYDAMNKGLSLATGDIVGILNSDDYYQSPRVLEKVVALFANENTDACYGDLVYIDKDNVGEIVRYWRSGKYDRRKFYWGWMPPHPTVFVRRSVYEEYGNFNLNLGSAADYELMLRIMVKYSIRVAYLPEILVRMRTGGASNSTFKSRILAHGMDRKAWEINSLKPYLWTLPLKPLRKLPQWFFKKELT